MVQYQQNQVAGCPDLRTQSKLFPTWLIYEEGCSFTGVAVGGRRYTVVNPSRLVRTNHGPEQ